MLSGHGTSGRNRTRIGRVEAGCPDPLDDGGMEHHQGIEPCRSGLQPDLLSQSCGAGQGTEESNLAASRVWSPTRFPERAPRWEIYPYGESNPGKQIESLLSFH